MIVKFTLFHAKIRYFKFQLVLCGLFAGGWCEDSGEVDSIIGGAIAAKGQFPYMVKIEKLHFVFSRINGSSANF